MIVFDKKIKSTFELVAATVDQITALLQEKYQLDKAVIFRISFMLREIINNAVEHGNQFDESKLIHIIVEVDENNMSFRVQDEGKGFTLQILEQVPDHYLRVRNRGIFLIKEFGFEIEVSGQVVQVQMHLPYEVNSIY
jgi:serine/threonine-protein kinase RsbW